MLKEFTVPHKKKRKRINNLVTCNFLKPKTCMKYNYYFRLMFKEIVFFF